MISIERMEEELPFPFKIVFCGDRTNFVPSMVIESVRKIKEKYNETSGTKLQNIKLDFYTEGTKEGGLKWDEFEIFIGKKSVYKGNITDDEIGKEFFDSVVSAAVMVLKKYGGQVFQVQEENLKKLEELKAEGRDDILFAYYDYYEDRKSFYHLKKLAKRFPYPGRFYYEKLRNVYMLSREFQNLFLAKKMTDVCVKKEKHEAF